MAHSAHRFPLDSELRGLMLRNLSNVTCRNNIHSGIYTKAGGDYFVVAACLHTEHVLLLMITDKIMTAPNPEDTWSWQYGRSRVDEVVSRLNRESVGGIHQIHEFQAGLIYVFTQCLAIYPSLPDPMFRAFIDVGIAEFDIGLAALSVD